MKLYTLSSIERLINHYLEKGGEIVTIEEGVLGYGKVLLVAEGLKTCVIQERFINSWSSGHTVRLYNKTPQKYERVIN